MGKTIWTSNLPAIAFALAALSATPAAAEAVRQEIVQYGDLNLGTSAGIAALDRRLDRAVARVCGDSLVRDLAAHKRIEECRADTWQSIQDDRQFAIAKATGQQGVQRAERRTDGQPQVSLAE